jgi:hypothetical protein
MSGCCRSICYKIERFSDELCKQWKLGVSFTAGSASGSGACGASAALVGITAAPAVLYGVTAGVVFYVTLGAMHQISDNRFLNSIVAAALAVIAGIFVTAAVLGVKVSIPAALIMSAASVGAMIAGYQLFKGLEKLFEDCCAGTRKAYRYEI